MAGSLVGPELRGQVVRRRREGFGLFFWDELPLSTWSSLVRRGSVACVCRGVFEWWEGQVAVVCWSSFAASALRLSLSLRSLSNSVDARKTGRTIYKPEEEI